MVAGPLVYKESKVEGMPPMRIYSRGSVMPDVDTAEMFNVT